MMGSKGIRHIYEGIGPIHTDHQVHVASRNLAHRKKQLGGGKMKALHGYHQLIT
jgi:hypothetical protein